MCNYIKIVSGKDLTIKELAYLIKEAVGFKGDIYFDKSKPDDALRKLLNNTKIKNLCFNNPLIELKNGLTQTYKYFIKTKCK